MEKESMFGQMDHLIKEPLKMEKDLDKVLGNLLELEGTSTLENTKKIKRVVMEDIFGPTAAFTKATSKMTISIYFIYFRHGKGRLTYQDGKEVKGQWEEGNLIGVDSDRRVSNHQESPLKKTLHLSSLRDKFSHH